MWIFLDSGAGSGSENMQLDEWLAREWFPETRRPVFRLYGWRPWTLSLGYHQSEGTIDEGALRRDGFELVRRPTGGRAVFHAEEITYSIVMDAGRMNVNGVYETISRALAEGLQTAGYDVSFSAAQPDLAQLYRQPGSIPCFTVSSRHEIQIGGRKLVGSAQRRYLRGDGGATVLQHGSILTGPAHRRLVDYLAVGEEIKSRLRGAIERSTTDLARCGSAPVDEAAVKAHLRDAVARELCGGAYEPNDHSFFMNAMRDGALRTEYSR
jgi:lipoate-protein ligase A